MRARLFLLSILPSALAVRLYSVPNTLALADADSSSECILPEEFHILNFKAESKEGGENLTSFTFTFKDTKTNITAPCAFNESSKVVSNNGIPRYNCDHADIDFIWQEDLDYVTMLEDVCKAADGSSQYEVAGSAQIFFQCPESGGACSTNSTDYKMPFVSLSPIQSPPNNV